MVLQDGAYGAFAEVWIHQEKPETVVWSRGVWIPQRTPIFCLGSKWCMQFLLSFIFSGKYQKYNQNTSQNPRKVHLFFCQHRDDYVLNEAVPTCKFWHPRSAPCYRTRKSQGQETWSFTKMVISMVASVETKNPPQNFGLRHLVGEMFDCLTPFLRHIELALQQKVGSLKFRHSIALMIDRMKSQ